MHPVYARLLSWTYRVERDVNRIRSNPGNSETPIHRCGGLRKRRYRAREQQPGCVNLREAHTRVPSEADDRTRAASSTCVARCFQRFGGALR